MRTNERPVIRFSPPDLSESEIENVVSVLRSGWITTGPRTKQLERELSDYFKTPRTVCVNSATAALELTLRVLGIGPGDEVITSAYTYTASASVIAHVGAKIVLVDVARDQFFMDPAQLAAAVTERTKAIIPIDFAGVIADYDNIIAIAEAKRGLFRPANERQAALGRVAVIADAAHALGSEQNGQRAGAIADFSCFSFHAVKNFTTGEGGCVTWRKDLPIDPSALYRLFMLYSLHGQTADALTKTMLGAWEYDIETLGYKHNMTDIMAAIGLAQLQRYPAILAKKKAVAAAYDKAFADGPLCPLRHGGAGFVSNAHLYIVRITGAGEAERNAFIAALGEAGIPANVHFKPLPMFTAYKRLGFDMRDYPLAYSQYANVLTLPCHSLLTDEAVAYITRTVNALLFEQSDHSHAKQIVV